MTNRHRLNRDGHRQANAALYRTIIVRLRFHQPTIAYVARRTAEGVSPDSGREGAHDAAAFSDWPVKVLLRLAGDAGPTASAVTLALHSIRRHPPAAGGAVLSDG